MSGVNWDDLPDAPEAVNWDDLPDAEPSAPSIGKGESALKGAEQGATFGFADEIGGGIQAGLDKLSGLFGESPSEINARLLAEGTTGNIGPTDSSQMYREARNENREDYRKAQSANPGSYLAGNVAGGVLANAGLPGVGLAPGAGFAKTVGNAALQGTAYGAGGSEQENIGGIARDAALGSATGAAGGALGYGLGKAAGLGLNKAGDLISKAAPGLEESAEKLAVKATGATGNQASNFSDDAGRELLDRGLVRFGDSPEKIAERVGRASEEAGNAIQSALSELDSKGVTASIDNVIDVLQNKVQELSEVPGNEAIIKQLQGQIDNLYVRGQSNLSISTLEQAKRNFQGQVNYFSPEAEKKGAFHVADALRGEVENAATNAAPEVADFFKEGKKTFSLLAPIKEAAEKRASTLSQSPFGGLGDAAAGAVGAAGGPAGSIVTAAGRRLISPRLASSLSISTDALAKIAAKSPQTLGKFANVIQQAAQRGSQAVAATNFVLQQQNPEYRQIMRQLAGTSDDD